MGCDLSTDMVLIDTHCHLDFPDYAGREREVLDRAHRDNIRYFLNVGTTRERSIKSVDLSERFEEVYASVGVHPHDSKDAHEEDYGFLEELSQKSKVVAFGEVGLDYYYSHSPHDVQKSVLERFLMFSATQKLPYIFHVRNAFPDFFQLIEKYRSGDRGVVHCFTGTWEEAERALELGLHISFTGILTFKKSQALRDVAAKVPLEKILLETDAPFLAPEGHRGKVNEPSFLLSTAKALAELKQVPLEEIARVTTDNCRRLFGFPGTA